MIINADDVWGKRILQEIDEPALTYGFNQTCAVQIKDYDLSLNGIRAVMDLKGQEISFFSPLIGKFNLHNIGAAAGTASILGISPSLIKTGIENLSVVPGRLEKIETSFGAHIFVDYAHKPDALTQVLHSLSQLKQRNIITVFGCGGNRDHQKRPLMARAATQYSDMTIITSDNPRLEDPLVIIDEIETGVDREKVKKISLEKLRVQEGQPLYAVIPDRREAIRTAVTLARGGDIVLIAGKGHEDYQISVRKINFDDRVVVRQILDQRADNRYGF